MNIIINSLMKCQRDDNKSKSQAFTFTPPFFIFRSKTISGVALRAEALSWYPSFDFEVDLEGRDLECHVMKVWFLLKRFVTPKPFSKRKVTFVVDAP